MSVPKKYQIGQVLYALFPEKYALIPFQIAEENVVRTLNRESTSYKAVYGPSGTVIELDAFTKKAIIYENLKDAHTALLNQAKQTIDKVVSDSAAKAKAWFPHAGLVVPQVQSIDFSSLSDVEQPQEMQSSEPVLELPDGTVGRIKFGATQQAK